ncbi:transmembrane protein 273-like isoform X2 [Hoplias malabaricus]|uniref:transmembrane protein 273-like isoform X2 n=1 Tax=Hoplias malabaricus TaxID=27720 RepID=UPI00346262F0
MTGMPDDRRPSHAVILLFTVNTLLRCVRGDGDSSANEAEVKYAVIGAGIGLVLVICFIGIKICMIKKHMLDNDPSEDSLRRPSVRCSETEGRTS